MGSPGFEPRLPTPQAGILDQITRNPPELPAKSGFLDQARLRPPQPKDKAAIINTLLKMRSEAKAESTIHSISQYLSQLSRKTNLQNPDQVKNYISTATNEKTNRPLSNGSKNKLCLAYEWYCKTNNIQWKKPFYKEAEGTPIIPTTEAVNKIIAAASHKFATIFTILAEIGAEGQELRNTPRNKIDTTQGTITITGTKGHGSATYKLKTKTTEMLREYLAKYTEEYPFPNPKIMAQIWRTTRTKATNNLNQPELKNIPMKNLRNYSRAKLYYLLPDPIAVMRHLRHKKLETTMHYIRGITINGEEEYIAQGATTAEECMKLIEEGFTKANEIDDIHIYKKRK